MDAYRQARVAVDTDDLAALDDCLAEMGADDTEWYDQLTELRNTVRGALAEVAERSEAK